MFARPPPNLRVRICSSVEEEADDLVLSILGDLGLGFRVWGIPWLVLFVTLKP